MAATAMNRFMAPPAGLRRRDTLLRTQVHFIDATSLSCGAWSKKPLTRARRLRPCSARLRQGEAGRGAGERAALLLLAPAADWGAENDARSTSSCKPGCRSSLPARCCGHRDLRRSTADVPRPA